jgi:FHA domain
MPTCPKGHDSVATDYCDECGTPIAGPPAPDAPPAAAPVTAGEPCPECGAPRTGRFCEVCGHDFAAAPAAPAPAAAAPDPAPAPPAPAPGVGSDGGLPRRVGPATGWRVVVTADREYHTRMRAAAVPDAAPIQFPAFCPERRFPLPNRQVLIGRRSLSRGIEPDIDLTGPPEDAAVSHAHALLVAVPEGWAVVDLDSANGTYLNDSPDPIEANVPVPVGDGDRIHVGAWTTMTLRAGS